MLQSTESWIKCRPRLCTSIPCQVVQQTLFHSEQVGTIVVVVLMMMMMMMMKVTVRTSTRRILTRSLVADVVDFFPGKS